MTSRTFQQGLVRLINSGIIVESPRVYGLNPEFNWVPEEKNPQCNKKIKEIKETSETRDYKIKKWLQYKQRCWAAGITGVIDGGKK